MPARKGIGGFGGCWRALAGVGGEGRRMPGFFFCAGAGGGQTGLAGAEFPGCGWDVWSAADARLFFCVRFGRCGRVFEVDSERSRCDAASYFLCPFRQVPGRVCVWDGWDGCVGYGTALNVERRDGMVSRGAADEWGLALPGRVACGAKAPNRQTRRGPL